MSETRSDEEAGDELRKEVLAILGDRRRDAGELEERLRAMERRVGLAISLLASYEPKEGK
jgi:hypothetical protein